MTSHAYVPIPKDLTVVKTKFIMGLTKRQAVCFTAAAATGLPLFFLLRTFLPTSFASILMLTVMVPWFLFAMYEKYGMPLEKYLKYVIAVKYKRPKIRTYQTNNLYTVTEKQIKLQKGVQRIVSQE